MTDIDPREITPEAVYLSRRKFMQGIGAVAAGAVASACGVSSSGQAPSGQGQIVPGSAPESTAVDLPPTTPLEPGTVSRMVDDLGDPLTAFEDITSYNNFYEFSTAKEAVAPLSQGFPTSPWSLAVGGLVNRPKTYDRDAIAAFTAEERIYRLRCVEGWSMVIPWLGFPLARLLEDVEPTSEARYVRFQTVLNPENMPGQGNNWFDWPYVEGLRIDEAMHDLAILATGLYGRPLPPQNGAPIRLVVPWKYGFKSVKSIVKIDLVAEQPSTFWVEAAPNEYGFYANVNPEVPHPRWSQATERRIGEFRRRQTLMFNGYADQVAHLYEGMDLAVQF